jgi:hypothetical protein
LYQALFLAVRKIGSIIGFLILIKSEIMKTTEKPITAMLFLIVLLSSCSHYYYVANVENVPLFKEKNEFRLSGIYGEGDETRCLEIQTAYSVTDNIGVMANFMSASGGEISSKNYGKGNYYEGAIGYYRPTAKSGVFEIYTGIGGSRQHHEYTSWYSNNYLGSSDLSFIKLFVQPSFGLTLNAFDIALSTRAGSLSYYNINNKISGDFDKYNDLNTVAIKNHFILEPAITLRAGWKNIKVQVQAGYAGIVNRPESNFGEEWHLTLGLNIALAKRYNKPAPKNLNF